MWKDKRLLELLGIEHPIIQAPMAGASTPEMAAASANSGCLGSLGCAMMSAEVFVETFARTRSMTNGALNMNFFCHQEPKTDQQKVSRITEHLKPYYTELGKKEMPSAEPTHFPFGGAVADAVIDTAPEIISFHFGLPDQTYVEALKDKGCKILCSATTPAEAMDLQSRAVDVIIAQGWEAGGHHGFYLKDKTSSIGNMALVPSIVDVVDIPVVAAGGIADGRGIAAALALGASGVQIGTAFLTCEESSAPKAHQESLMASDGSNTTLTRVFSGRPARGLENRYTDETLHLDEDLPDFPLMNTLTGPLRKASAASGKPDFIAQWSGQAVSLNREMKTQTLISCLIEETQEVLQSL
jgi:nitronate monooxygenase